MVLILLRLYFRRILMARARVVLPLNMIFIYSIFSSLNFTDHPVPSSGQLQFSLSH